MAYAQCLNERDQLFCCCFIFSNWCCLIFTYCCCYCSCFDGVVVNLLVFSVTYWQYIFCISLAPSDIKAPLEIKEGFKFYAPRAKTQKIVIWQGVGTSLDVLVILWRVSPCLPDFSSVHSKVTVHLKVQYEHWQADVRLLMTRSDAKSWNHIFKGKNQEGLSEEYLKPNFDWLKIYVRLAHLRKEIQCERYEIITVWNINLDHSIQSVAGPGKAVDLTLALFYLSIEHHKDRAPLWVKLLWILHLLVSRALWVKLWLTVENKKIKTNIQENQK